MTRIKRIRADMVFGLDTEINNLSYFKKYDWPEYVRYFQFYLINFIIIYPAYSTNKKLCI